MVIPMWSIFWGLVFYYSPLYMRQIGLSEIEIGLVNTTGMIFAFLCHLIASPITNRLGRKRTSLVFDLIAWSGSMLIWAISQNFWYFLVAGIVNALSKIVSVSWNCLISEDEKKEKVPKIYTILSLINSSIGIFALITGFFIAKFGLVGAMRGLYAIGAVSMAVMFIVRNLLVTETAAGKKLMNDHRGLTVLESVGGYFKLMSGLYRNRTFVLLLIVFVTSNFILTLNIFQIIFLKEELAYSGDAISLVPFIIALSNILVFVFAVPRLARMRSETNLALSIAGSLVGSVLFLFIPKGDLVTMLAIMALNGTSLFLLAAYRDSLFMNSQGEHDKADMYAAVQTLTTLCCIPAGFVGGALYELAPVAPFVLVAVMNLVALCVAIYLSMRAPASRPSLSTVS
jgi:MFS family permease